MRRVMPLVALVVLAQTPVPAGAARFAGEWSNAYSGQQGRVRFVGRLDPAAGVVSGRVRCRRCPPRGRLALSCEALQSNARRCTGTSATGCAVEGYVYATVFEGTWSCGPGTGGVLSFGHR